MEIERDLQKMKKYYRASAIKIYKFNKDFNHQSRSYRDEYSYNNSIKVIEYKREICIRNHSTRLHR